MGLWCAQAGSQGILVYREGNVAARLRTAAAELGPGEFDLVEGLTRAQALFGQAIAQEAGIWATAASSSVETSGGDGVEVWNLKLFNNGHDLEDFARGVRKTLAALRPGEVLDFPSVLSEQQRDIVHAVAGEFGLMSKTLKDPPKGSHVSVGHLLDFQHRATEDLSSLGAGEARKYGPGHRENLGARLSRLERSVLQQLATDMGFQSSEREDGRGGSIVGVQSLAQNKPAVEEYVSYTVDQDEVRQKVAKLFSLYSSGKQGEKKFFLRKIDLTRFVQDAAQVSPRAHILQGCLDAILTECEHVFDETLELQIDLGCRKRYGLVQEYFQVFLSKASYILGWSMVSLLFALLQLFEG